MEFDLQRVLRALLVSTSEALSVKEIQSVVTRYHEWREESAGTELDEAGLPVDPESVPAPEQGEIEDIINQVPLLLTAAQIREAMEKLDSTMRENGEPTRVVAGPKGYKLTVAPEYADWIRLLRNEAKPKRLSAAVLETLAVVAYRQPVTRAEMEALRGVAVDSALARLCDLELVCVSGRAETPGRPQQYATTQKFLEFAGLKTISELPESDVLSPAQIAEWLQKAMRPQTPKTAADVGLAEDETLNLTEEFQGE